jgi:hypothetical protein
LLPDNKSEIIPTVNKPISARRITSDEPNGPIIDQIQEEYYGSYDEGSNE